MQTTSMNALMHEMELQKKRMNLAALSSMQDYLKQLISLSLLQENIKSSTKLAANSLTTVSKPPTQTNAVWQKSHSSKLYEQLANSAQKEEKTAILSQKSTEIQVKCEEGHIDLPQVKIEQMEEEPNRKSDVESRNSGDMEIQRGDALDLFPRKKKDLLCPHPWRKHHAKSLCKKCYEKYGRTKKPTNCEHQVHFAKGYCRKCYFKNFKKSSRVDPEIYNELKGKLCSLSKKI